MNTKRFHAVFRKKINLRYDSSISSLLHHFHDCFGAWTFPLNPVSTRQQFSYHIFFPNSLPWLPSPKSCFRGKCPETVTDYLSVLFTTFHAALGKHIAVIHDQTHNLVQSPFTREQMYRMVRPVFMRGRHLLPSWWNFGGQ